MTDPCRPSIVIEVLRSTYSPSLAIEGQNFQEGGPDA